MINRDNIKTVDFKEIDYFIFYANNPIKIDLGDTF